MEYLLKFNELEKYFEKADFTDVKVFEGETTLRKFIASMLSYYPWWIVQLYRIRKILVIVRCAKEDLFWVSETPDDKHLRAYFGVVKEPVSRSINRFYVMTTVFYKHWTGPIYFNLIRPFHHLVVSRMAQYGLTH
jgi:hypothetical protein